MFIALLVSLPFLILISLIVFGGGQVFMPLFSWLWKILASTLGANIDDNIINQVFTVSNSTPGVVSTKFAFFTGYLVANGQWWGYIALFITYLVFCLPAIICMSIAMKYLNKFKTNTYFQNLIILFKPLIAGIMISLALELLISISLPKFYFNKSFRMYVGQNNFEKVQSGSLLDLFNTSTQIGLIRTYFLYVFLVLATIISILAFKYKVKLVLVILINILLAINLIDLIPEIIIKLS